MGIKIGDRMGAICCIRERNGKRVAEIFGFGVYQGEQIPETEEVKLFGISLKEEGWPNPCIFLDNGKKVYGCECWWGAEGEVKKMLEQCDEVIVVDIEQFRRKKNQQPLGG